MAFCFYHCRLCSMIEVTVMHDSGIGIGSRMIPFFAGIGIKNIKIEWNLNWNQNRSGIREFFLESELELKSEILKILESESES